MSTMTKTVRQVQTVSVQDSPVGLVVTLSFLGLYLVKTVWEALSVPQNNCEPFRNYDFRLTFTDALEETESQQQSQSKQKQTTNKNSGYRDTGENFDDDQQHSDSDDSETEELGDDISSNDTLKNLLDKLKKLLDRIQSMVNGEQPDSFLARLLLSPRRRNSRRVGRLYRELLDILQPLIHNHAAVFNHHTAPRTNNGITLTVGGEHVFFGRDIQSFFNGAVTALQGNEMATGEHFSSIIYRIRCCKCQPGQFNYVGQTVVQMNQRANVHIHYINTRNNSLLGQHVRNQHPNSNPVAVYEMDLLHHLPVNASSPRDRSPEGIRDKRIRRAWEMFYQWVFKAMYFDGGGSKK